MNLQKYRPQEFSFQYYHLANAIDEKEKVDEKKVLGIYLERVDEVHVEMKSWLAAHAFLNEQYNLGFLLYNNCEKNPAYVLCEEKEKEDDEEKHNRQCLFNTSAFAEELNNLRGGIKK